MMGGIYCLITVIEGILLLAADFLSFVYRKVTVGIGLCWGAFALVMLMLGSVPGLSAWSRSFPKEAVPAFLLISVIAIAAVFYLSCVLSRLLCLNRELAMHVSLLARENERILHELQEITEKNAAECDGMGE